MHPEQDAPRPSRRQRELQPGLSKHTGSYRLGTLPSATGGLTRLAYAHVKAAGFDADGLLTTAGLTPKQVNHPDTRLKVRDQIKFLNLASQGLQDDLLGFHLAQRFDLREIGLLYYVSASSETLSDALRRAARYSCIVNEGVSLEYIEGKNVSVRFTYMGVNRHFDRHQIEFFATALVRICRQLAGCHLKPVRVRFTHRRNPIGAEFLKFFGEG